MDSHRGKRKETIVDGMEQPVCPGHVVTVDAKEDLSIQVYPDDAYAAEKVTGSLRKTEMWYVIEAEEDAQIFYGSSHGITLGHWWLRSRNVPISHTVCTTTGG